jgi:hypothetical protein
MNVKFASLTLAAALFAATSAFAGQPHGRDSVYANPGVTLPSAKVAKTSPGNGRGTVTAYDLPAPTPKDKSNFAASPRPGRA